MFLDKIYTTLSEQYMNGKYSKVVTENLNINILFFNLKKSNGNTGGTANNENNE